MAPSSSSRREIAERGRPRLGHQDAAHNQVIRQRYICNFRIKLRQICHARRSFARVHGAYTLSEGTTAAQAEEEQAGARAALDLDILRDDVGFQVHITRRATGQSLRWRQRPRAKREPSGYMSSLVLIGANPGVSQQEIAAVLLLDAPNLAAMVTKMVEAGLVVRINDQGDRRRYGLTLTRAGTRTGDERLPTITAASQAQSKRIAHGLASEEMSRPVALLGRVQVTLRDRWRDWLAGLAGWLAGLAGGSADLASSGP